MAEYRLKEAVATVVSAIFQWGGILTAAYAAITGYGPALEFGKLLSQLTKSRPTKSTEHEEILDERAVCELLNIPLSCFKSLRKTSGFPPGKPIGKRKRRWMRSEIVNWIARQ
jgi:predicted DNA-binding transcriptional regulator AlpA